MATSTYKSVLNQDIWDICIIIYGSFNYMTQLMQDNNLRITDYIFPGTLINYDSNFTPSNVAFSTGELIYQPPPIPPVILQQPQFMTVAHGSTFTIPTQISGNPLTFEWRYNSGLGWHTLTEGQDSGTFKNVNTQNLLVTNVNIMYNNYQFDLLVNGFLSDGTPVTIVSDFMTLTVT